MPKRKYKAPVYITDRLEELKLIQTDDQGRKILRDSMSAAHERFREYDGPRVYLFPLSSGKIHAQFALTSLGYQHEDEIL